MGDDTLLRHFSPTATVRYSAFTSDPIRADRDDLREVLSQLAMFAVGRLVDYFIVWNPDSSDFETPHEEEVLRALNTHLQLLGAAPLVFLDAEKEAGFQFRRNQRRELNQGVAGTFTVAASSTGLLNRGHCPDASEFSPVTAIGWSTSRDRIGIVSPHGPLEMHPNCAGAAIRGFHVSQGVYQGLFDRQRLSKAELSVSRSKPQSAAREYFIVSGTVGLAVSPSRTALVEQPHRFETALLQRLEIPLHTFGVAHTYIDAPHYQKCHNNLRDSIIAPAPPFGASMSPRASTKVCSIGSGCPRRS